MIPACKLCGTWVCDNCGARRKYANRFSEYPQSCPRQCGSSEGKMLPVTHLIKGKRDDHESSYLFRTSGQPPRYPLEEK